MQYSALYPAKKRGSIVKPTNEMVQIAPSILAHNGEFFLWSSILFFVLQQIVTFAQKDPNLNSNLILVLLTTLQYSNGTSKRLSPQSVEPKERKWNLAKPRSHDNDLLAHRIFKQTQEQWAKSISELI